MSDKNIDLSRRKILAGLGAVGAAGAGAGLGTSAFFSDEESFDGNVITAGELDLAVGYYSYWDQGIAGSGSRMGTADGESVSGELTDVKPGDSGLLAFCPRIEDNPAYLWLCGELTANDENTVTEPEAAADPNHDTPSEEPLAGGGELAEAVQVSLAYCRLDEVEDEFGPGDVTESTEVWSGSFAALLAGIENGVALDGDGATGEDGSFPAPGDQACFDGSDGEADNPCLCLAWELPTDVGNEVQTDSMAFDLTFHAQQCRHNDGRENPCCGCGPEEVALTRSDGTRTCVPVWDGDASIEEFYDYGHGSPYATQNPDIQTQDTTNLLVYDDGSERSLVVVHDVWDGVADETDPTGGTVSGTFSGLDPAYSWQVRDDDPGNDTYDAIDSATESIDWTWSSAMTDGGAIGPLDPAFDVGIDLELIEGIGTVQYLTQSGEAISIADDVESGETVSTRLAACAASSGAD
jgi:predicted ribosomally synthesized peptide with SipW-like signal peptide